MTATIEHRQVEANGVSFRVAVSGPADAPPILLIHGFPEGSMGWRPLMERLREFRCYAPDLRGYPGSGRSSGGYDVMTLTDDIKALIAALGLEKPPVVSHDWGGALGWIFAHRYPELISRLVVVNCTHPRTLVRAALHFEDWQPLRIPWVPLFQPPWVPEAILTTGLGRKLLRLSFTTREGRKGTMDTALVDQLVDRFQEPADFRGPINYYRQFVLTHLIPARRRQLFAVYDRPITVPVTLVWGLKDGALSSKVAIKSYRDAGCEVDWRPLPGIGHFVDLEAPDLLASEVRRALAGG